MSKEDGSPYELVVDPRNADDMQRRIEGLEVLLRSLSQRVAALEGTPVHIPVIFDAVKKK